MKNFTENEVLELTKGANKVYSYSTFSKPRNKNEFKRNLDLIKIKNKKEKLKSCLEWADSFIITKGKYSLNIEVLEGDCVGDSFLKDFEVGKTYDLKFGDPVKITAKFLGSVSDPIYDGWEYAIFQEGHNFYFFFAKFGKIFKVEKA